MPLQYFFLSHTCLLCSCWVSVLQEGSQPSFSLVFFALVKRVIESGLSSQGIELFREHLWCFLELLQFLIVILKFCYWRGSSFIRSSLPWIKTLARKSGRGETSPQQNNLKCQPKVPSYFKMRYLSSFCTCFWKRNSWMLSYFFNSTAKIKVIILNSKC